MKVIGNTAAAVRTFPHNQACRLQRHSESAQLRHHINSQTVHVCISSCVIYSQVVSNVPVAEHAVVGPDEHVQYNSTALLTRSQDAMHYNRTTGRYETPQLAVWFGTDSLFYSRPTEGIATWLDVLVAAKHPW